LITVGVYDSGVGGLSVLRALRTELPQVHFVYLADNAHAPYGERLASTVTERAHHITALMRREHGIGVLVVACNTATALAIDELRQAHPDLPFIGVEPALKPAAAATRSGHIGVLATRGTVESARFARLLDRVSTEAGRPLHFSCQPCDGLADAIERGDQAAVLERATHHLQQLQDQNRQKNRIDTLVLGCTHYPFASDVLQTLCGAGVQLIETGSPVARRTREVLVAVSETAGDAPASRVTLLCTGSTQPLTVAAQRWLGLAQSARCVSA
jgi:glutamate racemase